LSLIALVDDDLAHKVVYMEFHFQHLYSDRIVGVKFAYFT